MSAILPKTFYFTKWKLYKQHDISRILNSPYSEKSYKLIKKLKIPFKITLRGFIKLYALYI